MKVRFFFHRFIAPIVFAAAALVSTNVSALPALAGPELERILSSTMGRFLMTETAGGRQALEAALGRAIKSGENLEVFVAKLREPGMEAPGALLEGRLRGIERQFQRALQGKVALASGAELTPAERSLLRILSQQELEQFSYVQLRSFKDMRRMFIDAIPRTGLKPTLRYPKGVDGVLHPDSMIQFGFESEFTMADLEGLLKVYGPAPEFGMPLDTWAQMAVADRVTWVKSNLKLLFPKARAMGGLIKLSNDPEHYFLPERLLRDSTGNLEIVLGPVDTFEQWKQRVYLLNEMFGAGSMQGTLSIPSDAFFGRAAPGAPARLVDENLGFFNFHNDLDTLEKLELGAARYARDPAKPAANSFNHPFLGPMTKLKQDHLIRYVVGNSRGELLDADSLKFVAYEDSSFKYTGGTAYRPDIVPGRRIVFEARDAHNNLDVLLDRMSRSLVYLQHGRDVFRGAASLEAFDSVGDFAKLPQHVQNALRAIFPPKLEAGVVYNVGEQLALEVFRNFAYPMRDWRKPLEFLGRADLGNSVRLAQRAYSAKISVIALEFQAGKIAAAEASLRIQGATVQFAKVSGLGEAYRARAKELLDATIHESRVRKAG